MLASVISDVWCDGYHHVWQVQNLEELYEVLEEVVNYNQQQKVQLVSMLHFACRLMWL